MSSEDSTPMRAITVRHLLFPASSARSRIGLSCDRLSRNDTLRDAIGFTTFRTSHKNGLGLCYTPGAQHPCLPRSKGKNLSPCRFGLSLSADLAHRPLRRLRRFTFVIRYRSAWPPDLFSARSPLVVSRLGDAFAGYVVLKASHPRITPDACFNRLPLTEQWVPFFVNQSGTMT